MKKLLFSAIVAAISSFAAADTTVTIPFNGISTSDGNMLSNTFTEVFAYTKATARSSEPYFTPANVVSIVDKMFGNWIWETDGKIKELGTNYQNLNTQVGGLTDRFDNFYNSDYSVVVPGLAGRMETIETKVGTLETSVGTINTTLSGIPTQISDAVGNERISHIAPFMNAYPTLPDGWTLRDWTEILYTNAVHELEAKEDALYAKVGPFHNVSTNVFGVNKGNVAIGTGAKVHEENGEPCGEISLNPYGYYPSYAYGSFNINLGIDNIVGNAWTNASKSSYSTTIGTSAKALSMHSYAYGSQINAIAQNTTVVGYGLSATSSWSTVIGHGKRPSTNGIDYDKKFTNNTELATWLQTKNNGAFVGSHFKSPDNRVYTVTKLLDSPSPAFGFYYEYVETSPTVVKKIEPGTKLPYGPIYYGHESDTTYFERTDIAGKVADDNVYLIEEWDYIPGGYDWRYGKSHGDGTFNIVAYHSRWGTKSPGLKAVFINDDCLYDLVNGGSSGPVLTKTQIGKGITYVNNGYEENSAIELGKDASSLITQSAVNSAPNNTKLRNVGIAIGARAVAEGNTLKNQSIAIGYCAHSKGSNAIAIGGGSKHFDDETDETGGNSVADGSTALSIGYGTKAKGTAAIAIGALVSNTFTKATGTSAIAVGQGTEASGDGSIAIGRYSSAVGNGAVQIGTGTNNTPNSLQFMGVKIVENGRLLGGNADPKEAIIPAEDLTTTGNELSIKLNPGSVYTILPEANCGPGTEISVEAPVGGLRNYEVYFPNEPEVCAGLPACVSLDEIPSNIKKVIVNNVWQAHKLPAKITLKQPYSRLVICEITEFDDGTDWSPIITGSNLYWTNGMFRTEGKQMLVGTNLHSGVSMKLVYPISASANCTNELMEINSDGIFDGTFYNYTVSLEYTPKSGEPLHSDGSGNTWYEILYSTKCGTKEAVYRKEFNSVGL